MYRIERKTVLFPLTIFAEELNLTGPDPTLTKGNEIGQTVQPAELPVPNQAKLGNLVGWTYRAGLCSQKATTGVYTVLFAVGALNAASEHIPYISGRTSLLCP